MKLFIVLSLLACGYADKLDRTYLPPASAGSAGGSPGSLVAPGQEPNFNQQAPESRGSQSQPGPLGQQSGPQQQQRGPVSGSPDFPQSRPSPATGFTQPAKPGNGLQEPSAGFRRPYGQSGGQVTPQVPNYAQPSGSGVQPPKVGFEPSLFGANVFSGPSPINKGFTGQSVQPKGPSAASESTADIFRYDNQIDGGSFSYEFETSNGILVEESGVASDGVQAHGEYAYTGDNGQFYKITYTADENGYLPQGDHLPTPPPIPQEILRSIEKNAQAAADGTQEGAYNPDDDAPQVFNGAYNPGQILLGGSNTFVASGSGFQAKTQSPYLQGSNKGANQQAFKAEGGNQQGFSGPNRQGQNGSQSQGQVGYDYSRPVNQGRQPSGNANIVPSSSTKAPGSQNQSRPFQGQIQQSSNGAFDQSKTTQGRYQSQEYNPPQKQPSGSLSQVLAGNKFNRGSPGVIKRIQQSGNHGPVSSFNQNRGFGSTGSQTNQGIPSYGQNRPIQNQNQPQKDSQGQIGSQAYQGQGGVQNQSGYEYNKPQPSFNSGNQGQFQSSQGQTRPSSQGSFPGPQVQNWFPDSTESHSGSGQGLFLGSNGTTRPQGSQGQQQGFPGSGTQSPKPSSILFESEPEKATSLKPKIPYNHTTQRQESFVGPRQQASFSFDEGYRY